MIQIKRVYQPYSTSDGYRILVDRLWPRGVSKEKAHVDIWFKEIAPSNELRTWFGHDPKKWGEFEKRYKEELKDKKDLVERIKQFEKEHKQITLVYGAKDTDHNQAVVIANTVQ